MIKNLLIYFILSLSFVYACTMDCKSCHPKFNIEQKEHLSLKICITCHTSDSIKNVNMGDSACGADCFSCHPVEKLNKLGIKEHLVMNSCAECHNNENFQKEKLLKFNNTDTLIFKLKN